MATLGTTIDRIAAELRGRTDLSSNISDAIRSAIQHYETFVLPWNQIRDWKAFTTVSGTQWYSLTSNFLRFAHFKLTYNNHYISLIPKTLQWIEEQDTAVSPSTGAPNFYTIFANEVRLFPTPSGSYTAVGHYISRLATLSASTTAAANSWLTSGEPLIRARAVADIRINLLNQSLAISELSMMMQTGEDGYLSVREKQAHQSVLRDTRAKSGTGKLQAHHI